MDYRGKVPVLFVGTQQHTPFEKGKMQFQWKSDLLLEKTDYKSSVRAAVRIGVLYNGKERGLGQK